MLKPITGFEDKEIMYFAGFATYTIEFSIPEDFIEPDHFLHLDIGDVEAVAEISLNGQPLGIAWLPGMRFEVTDILKGENQLEAVLTTTFRNRIIGDYREYGELKNAWTSAHVGNYLSDSTALKPTGLMGPLRLVKSPSPQ